MAAKPQLRFAGFTADWEEKRLDKMLTISKEKNSENTFSKNDVLSVSREVGTVNQIEYKGRSFAGKSVKNYKVVQPGQIVYTKSPLKGAPYGIFQQVTQKGIVSPLYAVYNSTKEALGVFVYLFLCDDKIATNLLAPIVSKGAKNTILVNEKDVLGIRLHFPSMQEQEKIVNLFQHVDSLITQQERKCTQLQTFKRAMLQQMFPQPGQAAPAVRFAGFTGPWEEKKLEAYLNVSTEKNRDLRYGKEDVLSVSGDLGIVNQIQFQGRSFAGKSVANYGVVKTNDVVYTKSPLKSNPYGIIKANKGKNGIVSTLYAVYSPKENVFSDFVQIYFESDYRMNSYMRPLVNKGAKNDMKVSAKNALKGIVLFPSLAEQQQIGAYFQQLDDLLARQRQRLTQLKHAKKYLLQNMFPQKG